MMRPIRIHEFAGINTMQLDEVPRPVPRAGEILVAVKAAGVGPWDRLVREGRSGLGQALPLILGSDVSGTVAALGPGVRGFALGQAVGGPMTSWTFSVAILSFRDPATIQPFGRSPLIRAEP